MVCLLEDMVHLMHEFVVFAQSPNGPASKPLITGIREVDDVPH
jgi:hypothetical protein